MLRLPLLTLFLLSGLPAAARELYRMPDHGNGVEFSDRPGRGAQSLELPDAPTRPAPRPPSATPVLPATPALVLPATGYTRLEVVDPGSRETVRDNNGMLLVTLRIEPALERHPGHQVQLLLDGEPAGPPRPATHHLLTRVAAGAHTLQFAVVDGAGRRLAVSAVSDFQLERAAAGK